MPNDKSQKKLLILSASVGAGHTIAASAVLEACRSKHPELNAEWLDSFDFCPRFYGGFYKKLYATLANRYPHFYGYCYDRFDGKTNKKKDSPFIEFLDRRLFKKFLRRIEEEQPTHILSTHFQPGDVVSLLKKDGRINAKVGIIGCDFYLHSLWETKLADFYVVATPEIKSIFVERGHPPESIHVIGIPVNPTFSEPFDRQELLGKLDCHDRSPIILTIASGWQKIGAEVIVEALVSCGIDMQILAVAGKNKESEEKMRAVKPPKGVDLHVFGFVKNVHEMMKVSDVFVAKPGGLATVEALSVGLPIIAMNPVPGQEEHNCHYVMEQGAGMLVTQTGSLKYKLRKFLEDKELAARMRERAKAIGRPRAAFDIADLIAKM
jgi:processive 1,2-diacylglycerol beta-glucosyltransferase